MKIRFRIEDQRIEASIQIREMENYLIFAVDSVFPEDKVDALVWGPIAVTVRKTIGEIIGVVSDDTLAFGLQVLNVKTLGGFPINKEGSDPSRSSTAVKTVRGSAVQAYSLNRSKPRTVDVWWGQFPRVPVEPVPGETVEGSAIALFGCQSGEVLERIGEIELAEGLPHPVIHGFWSKRSPETGRSYLIADFSEETIDELLAYTQKANLMTLYHMNAWQSWGHYELNPFYFPNGLTGLKGCLEKAQALGIRLGAHTLTDFINTNDPYVTPVPDKRLALTGSSILTESIGAEQTEIPVASAFYFANEKANWLHTVRIGDELIRYDTVIGSSPAVLKGCTRGAFGTRVSSHTSGGAVGKLLDHPYMVFFPNLDLMKEIAINLAHRFNETGFSQMDFDGHEGCLSAGQGDYGMELFAKLFYENLDHEVLNGTSNSEPFYWHINTYCNWGEPWYGGFTESMQQYRIDNQGLFDRNYLPHMLGWYLLTDSTTLAEMEWMLARAAGYNAGFAMATSLEALRNNRVTDDLLNAIRIWEICRRDRAFPSELIKDLKDPEKEFHMEQVSPVVFKLYPMKRVVVTGAEPVYEMGEPIRIIIPVD
ncbi:MAG TPA: hypothetical protein PK711_03755 [Bacteroidales bacterium]|nr:hypothetical protein [Bacteroidales bacterium]